MISARSSPPDPRSGGIVIPTPMGYQPSLDGLRRLGRRGAAVSSDITHRRDGVHVAPKGSKLVYEKVAADLLDIASAP